MLLERSEIMDTKKAPVFLAGAGLRLLFFNLGLRFYFIAASIRVD